MARISRVTRKRLGELLQEEGLVSDEQLEAALAVHRREHRPLGEVLVEQGVVSEEDIARVLCHQYGLPYLDPLQYDIDPQMKAVFPEAALLKYHFIPLDAFDASVLIVTSGVLEPEVIDELEGACGKRIHAVVGTATAVRKVQVEHFHAQDEELTSLGSLLLGDEENG